MIYRRKQYLGGMGGFRAMEKGSKPLNEEPETARRTRLAPEVRSKIAHELRAFYSGIVDEGIPKRFT